MDKASLLKAVRIVRGALLRRKNAARNARYDRYAMNMESGVLDDLIWDIAKALHAAGRRR